MESAEASVRRSATPNWLSGLTTFLFTPGSSEKLLAKALRSPADAVVIDWEDAVRSDEKAKARELTSRVLSEPQSFQGPCLVRVNAVDTPDHDADIAALADVEPDAIVLPKASVCALDSLHDNGLPVIAIVETAIGLQDVERIANHRLVQAVAFGAVDFAAELGIVPSANGLEFLYARSRIVVASVAAGLRSPIDTAYVDVACSEGLEREAKFAKSQGFGAKFCIHPGQLDIVARAFRPSEKDLEWARQVLEHLPPQHNGGVFRAGDTMVDGPVLTRAQRILQQCEEQQ